MIKIDLTEYKESKIYFQLFDLIISENEDNKDKFLKSLDINPSTYRRCRQNDFTISEKIIYKVATYYGYVIQDNNVINSIEKLFNDIYFDLYYKIYTKYDNYINMINSLIERNYIVTPILKLFKIFLIASSQKDYEVILQECNILYLDIKKYVGFFNGSLLKIYELIYLMLESKIEQSKLLKSYDDGSAYYILSYRNLLENKYLESLYYGEKSKKILLEDGNIVRLILQNNTIITCYMNVQNYEESLKILTIQNKILEAIEYKNNTIIKKTKRAYIVCLFALNKYEELLDYLKEDNRFTFTTIACYLISWYVIDKERYSNYLNNILKDYKDDKTKQFINMIDVFNKTKDIDCLKSIDEFKLNEQFVRVLKNKVKNDQK